MVKGRAVDGIRRVELGKGIERALEDTDSRFFSWELFPDVSVQKTTHSPIVITASAADDEYPVKIGDQICSQASFRSVKSANLSC